MRGSNVTRLAILPPLECDLVLAWLHKNLSVYRRGEIKKINDFYVLEVKFRETPVVVQALLKRSFGKAVRII